MQRLASFLVLGALFVRVTFLVWEQSMADQAADMRLRPMLLYITNVIPYDAVPFWTASDAPNGSVLLANPLPAAPSAIPSQWHVTASLLRFPFSPFPLQFCCELYRARVPRSTPRFVDLAVVQRTFRPRNLGTRYPSRFGALSNQVVHDTMPDAQLPLLYFPLPPS